MATVVLKLFNLVGPQRAYFGQKDAQQAIIITPAWCATCTCRVQVRVLPIVRDADGLALSSRNVYLSAGRTAGGPGTCPGPWLRAAALIDSGGERRRGRAKGHGGRIGQGPSAAQSTISPSFGCRTWRNSPSSQPGNTLIAAAIRVGKTRLIDNLLLGDLSC